jgi:ELWxxDGT repeat protein
VSVSLLRDINLQPASSNPYGFLTIGTITYFSADDGVHSRQLWRTDGTSNGTFMLKDIDNGNGDPFPYANLNGELLFAAGHGYGNELWGSDGTAGGTRLLKTFSAAHPPSGTFSVLTVFGNAAILLAADGLGFETIWRTDGTAAGTTQVENFEVLETAVVDNTIVFAGGDPTHGVELWKTDGTTAGTQLVKDIVPGSGSSNPFALRAAGNLVFFVADDGVHGREVWRSDGTTDGTFMVQDIWPGPGSSIRAQPYQGYPNPFTAVGNQVFFNARDPTYGDALWVSDGTTAGTHLVIGAAPGSGPLYAGPINPSGSGAYFLADDLAGNLGLWRSDGSAAGTYLVEQNPPAPFQGVATLNGLFFFFVGDGMHPAQLWVTDGTSGGTAIIHPGSAGAFVGVNGSFIPWGSTLYFFADDGIHGVQMWKTDGTTAGTVEVTAINPFFYGGGRVVNGVMLLSATDAQHGTELWRSYGTSGETRLIKDINSGTLGSFDRTDFEHFVSFNGSTYFGINDAPSGVQLWKTNGTTASTQFVAQVGPWLGSNTSGLFDLTVVGNTLFFVTNVLGDYYGDQLWKSDGTSAGTVLVTSAGSAAGPLAPSDFVAFNGDLYFIADSSAGSRELWKSDGTTAGTVMIANFYPASGITSSLVVTHGLLFFITGGTELWKSDGSTAGTTVVQTLATQAPTAAPSLFGLNGELYYSSNADGQGWQLWKTDGTLAGTALVRVLRPGGDAFPTNFVNVNGQLYFTAFVQTGSSIALWRSDGSSAGTEMVSDFSSHVWDSAPDQLTNVNGRVFFAAADATTGEELWQSDGTAQGTRIVAVILAHTGYSLLPQDLTAFNGLLIFTANDGVHGRNLWASDGTQAGTLMIPGVRKEGPSSPAEVSAIGNTLYFVADDAIHGVEPWILRGTSTRIVSTVEPPVADLSLVVAGAGPTTVFAGHTGATETRFALRLSRDLAGLSRDASVPRALRLSSRQVDALFSWLGRDRDVWNLEEKNVLTE